LHSASASELSTVAPPGMGRAKWRDAQAVTTPTIVHSRADIASLLRAHRMASGMTCEDLDARAGWSDRYTAKLEHGDKPSGKAGFVIAPPTTDSPADPTAAFSGRITVSMMGDVWLESLGLTLVLMPVQLANEIGAVMAPRKQQQEAA
jgi:hypothetical protein